MIKEKDPSFRSRGRDAPKKKLQYKKNRKAEIINENGFEAEGRIPEAEDPFSSSQEGTDRAEGGDFSERGESSGKK